MRQQMDYVQPEMTNLPEDNGLYQNETEHIANSTPAQTSSGKQVRFSPYSTKITQSKKIEKQRKILANELDRLSQINPQTNDNQPESIPLPDDNGLYWDEAEPNAASTPIITSNDELKTHLNSNRVQFKRKNNNTVNYRITPDDQSKSLIKASEFKTLPPSVAKQYWVSPPTKSPYAYKKFKKYTRTKKHLLDGSFKET